MKVVTTLFWYDESPEDLHAAVSSLKGFADRIVAVNGRWVDPEGLEFPKADPDRSREEIDAILDAADEIDIEATIHRGRTFPGEIAQRNYTLQHALVDADWIYLMDADERIASHQGVRETLEHARLDVGTVRFESLKGPQGTATTWEKLGEMSFQRRVFRAKPDMRFWIHHWWLVDDEQCYWGDCGRGKSFAKAFDLEMVVEHRTALRTPERWAKKREFIKRRDPADELRGWEH